MIFVREMELSDVEAVSKMEENAFSMPWLPKDFIEMIEHDQATYLVAEIDEMIVGACGVRNIVGDGEITNVVVREERQRQGIGLFMITELINRGMKTGIDAFTLEVRKSNLPAIILYEKLGFITEGIRKDFYNDPQEDALIMWKR